MSEIESYIFNGVLLGNVTRSEDGGWDIVLKIPQYLKESVAGVITSDTTVFTIVMTPHVTKEEE